MCMTHMLTQTKNISKQPARYINRHKRRKSEFKGRLRAEKVEFDKRSVIKCLHCRAQLLIDTKQNSDNNK